MSGEESEAFATPRAAPLRLLIGVLISVARRGVTAAETAALVPSLRASRRVIFVVIREGPRMGRTSQVSAAISQRQRFSLFKVLDQRAMIEIKPLAEQGRQMHDQTGRYFRSPDHLDTHQCERR